jgi:opacity protein-like surface antigen
MRVLLVLVFIFTLVHADRNGGPYIGLGYGISEYKDDGKYEDVLEKNSNNLNYYLGAYINKHLSVELGYAKIIGNEYKVLDSTKVVALDHTLYNISTLAHYAFFDDMLDFYLKFGTGYVKLFSETGFSFVYGIGTSFRLSEMFSLKVAYDLYEFGYDKNADNSTDYKMRIAYPYVAIEFQF